ncbi:hypothetical protein BIW11_03067, partial [Tropilaelaps mercedesae]
MATAHAGQTPLDPAHMRAFAAQQHSAATAAAAAQMYNPQFQSPPPGGAAHHGHTHLAATGQAGPGSTAAAAASDHTYQYFSQQQQQQDLYRFQQQQNQYRTHSYFPGPTATPATAGPYGSAQQSGHFHQMSGHSHYPTAMQTPPQAAAAFSTAGIYAHAGHNPQAAARYCATMKDASGQQPPQQPTSYEQSTPPPYGHAA